MQPQVAPPASAAPSLHDLPSPGGQTGWPWVEAGLPGKATMPGGRPWPRVTIVTPSYNQAPFLEAALRSVLLQGYRNLEYFVMDGGSADDSPEIIQKYASWLKGWVSKPDGGQAAAINQAFAEASGEILAWLNADDLLLPGAVARAVETLTVHPEAALVHGDCEFIDAAGHEIASPSQAQLPNPSLEDLLADRGVVWQPGAFFRREAFRRAGPLDEDLYYSMDYELLIRLRQVGEFIYQPGGPVAAVRIQPQAKTFALPLAMIRERYWVSRRHGGNGVTAALKVLRLRWGGLVQAAGDREPDVLINDMARDGYRSLPAPLRRAARPLASEFLAAQGFEAYRRGQPRQAARCLARAALHQPNLLLNRGVLSILARGAFRSPGPG